MRHNRILLLILMQVFVLSVSADEYTDPNTNVVYSYTKGSGVATITDLADITSFPPNPFPVGESSGKKSGQEVTGDITILDIFKVDDEEYVVTSIGDGAFQGMTELTSVIIPNTVISMGTDVFQNCVALKSVSLSPNIVNIENGTFLNDSCLVSIDFKSVVSVGSSAFRNCISLVSINLPNCLSLGERAFQGCSSLKEITLGNCSTDQYQTFSGCPQISSVVILDGSNNATISGFDNCTNLSYVKLGNGVAAIGDSAFKGCKRLTSINIPQSVTSIGLAAFYGCDSLSAVTIEDAAASIGENAFLECKSLQTLNLGKNITDIGKSAFYGCVKLKSLTIPKQVSAIRESTFAYCTNLASVEILEGVDSIGSSAFNSCKNLNAVTIGEGLIYVGKYAFQKCSELMSITLPNSVKTIGDAAFSGCESLASITLSTSLDSIGSDAFEDCKSMKLINIPSDITYVGNDAFNGSGLTSVIIPAGISKFDGAFYSDDLMHVVSEIEDPFEISTSTFSPETYQKGTLVVPVGTVEKYQLQVGWRDFEEIVEVGHEPQTEFMVNVEQEGTLKELVTALNANKIRSLTIKGRLNGTDIKFLRENETLQNYLDSLDLGGVTLVPGGESYYTYVIPGGDGDYWSSTTYYIYLSDHEEMTHLKTDAVGWGAQSYNKWESDALPYAFVGMNFTLKKIVLPAGLPKIGEHMFKGFEKLESVVAPEQITEIRESAFSGCSSLVQIEGMDISHLQIIDNDAFSGCAKLKLGSLNLASAKRIGEKAFYGCGKISELVLGDDLEYVGRAAFSRCTSLTSIKYNPELATLYSYNSFDDWWINSLPVEDDIVYMGRIAMQLQEGKATPSIMKLRDGTLCIANGFAQTIECKYIQQIDLPATIKRIGDESFYSTKIQNLNLPEGLLEIGEYAFSSSKQLTELSIPESVERIGKEAFSGCEAMTSLKLNGRVVEDAAFSGCNNLRTVTIGAKVNTLGYAAFSSCDSLRKVVFLKRPSTERLTIGDELFRFDKCLSSINLPEGTDYIGTSAFVCDSLKSLTIPSTVKGLGSTIFFGDTIISMIKDPYPIADDTFDKHGHLKGRTLFVPNGKKSIYEVTEGWNLFENIVELDALEIETTAVKISAAMQVPYCSDKNLDFTNMTDLKAYVATGYDKTKGTIWLTRVKQVPANTGFLLVGDAGDYDIPVAESAADCYYKNMFKGTISGETIYTTDGEYTNYYLSNGDKGVGFYKVTKEEGQSIGANRCYLPILTDIPAVGSEGNTVAIKVSAAKQVPYYTSTSLDFTSMEAEGVKAYTATGYNYGTGTIWLSRVKKVPAKTGVLIMANEAGDYDIPTASVAATFENMFVGSETAQTIKTIETIDGVDYVNYYLSNGTNGVGFYKVTNADGQPMGANRCYLQIPKRTSSGARGESSEDTPVWCEATLLDEVVAIPLFADGTTGIDNNNREPITNNLWYNLQGQRVERPGKGIYIRNGKKVVIK